MVNFQIFSSDAMEYLQFKASSTNIQPYYS